MQAKRKKSSFFSCSCNDGAMDQVEALAIVNTIGMQEISRLHTPSCQKGHDEELVRLMHASA